MSLLSRAKDWLQAKAISSTLDLFREVMGSRVSSSGATVNWESALTVGTVLACCRVIASGLSQVPFRLYKEDDTGSKSPHSDHPLSKLFRRSPDGVHTTYEFIESMVYHLLLCGNAYIWVGRVGIAREVRRLMLLVPGRVTIHKEGDTIKAYEYRGTDGSSVFFDPSAVWHLRGPSWDGVVGMETIRLARESIGLSLAMEKAHSAFYKNGANASGVLSVDGKLNPEQYDKLVKWIDQFAIGGSKNGAPMILDNGAKWSTTMMKATDAQQIETRRHQIEEICRQFGVMPLMVGHPAEMAARAATESIFIQHVIHCLAPQGRRIETSADFNLLTEAEQEGGLYFKFTFNALMRGSAKDRSEYFQKALGAGGHGTAFMSVNEVRGLEDLPLSKKPEHDEVQSGVADPAAAPSQTEAETGDTNSTTDPADPAENQDRNND